MDTNLQQKTDADLIADLKGLVSKERQLLTQILDYLGEIEARKLYLARGYSSLFAFMTVELGYSESAAQRRIQAIRQIKDLPEVKTKLEKGEISLTVVSQVQSFFRAETEKRKEAITRTEKLELIQSLQGTSARECEKRLAQISPEISILKEKTRPLTHEKTLIQFTAGKNLMNKIQKLRSLLSHQAKTGSLEELFEKLSDMALEKLDPERREARRQKRRKCTSPPPAPAVKGTRHIPYPLRDQVWLRDQGQCQHHDPRTGKICGSRQKLELDHKFPYALGGETSAANLQLRCEVHNQWRGGMLFGKG